MSTQYQRRRFEILPVEFDERFQKTSFYWLLIAANGRILMRSSRNFPTKPETRKNIKLIRRTIALAGVVDRAR